MRRGCSTLRFLPLLILPVGLFHFLVRRAAAQPPAGAGLASSPVDVALGHYRNLEHDLAQKQLDAWLAEHPNDLRALNYLASVKLQREMLRRELLESQVYGPKGEAFQRGKVALPAGFQQELFGNLSKAEGLAENRLTQNPRDEDYREVRSRQHQSHLPDF